MALSVLKNISIVSKKISPSAYTNEVLMKGSSMRNHIKFKYLYQSKIPIWWLLFLAYLTNHTISKEALLLFQETLTGLLTKAILLFNLLCRDHLEKMLAAVKCEIISMARNGQVDAYVLSESSMFISQRRFILVSTNIML